MTASFTCLVVQWLFALRGQLVVILTKLPYLVVIGDDGGRDEAVSRTIVQVCSSTCVLKPEDFKLFFGTFRDICLCIVILTTVVYICLAAVLVTILLAMPFFAAMYLIVLALNTMARDKWHEYTSSKFDTAS